MISKESSAECYVYITLPGETSSVTAGRFVLGKTAQAQALGRFVYGRSYLKNPDAVEFDPIELVDPEDGVRVQPARQVRE